MSAMAQKRHQRRLETGVWNAEKDVVEKPPPVLVFETRGTIGGEKLNENLIAEAAGRETEFTEDGAEKSGNGRRQRFAGIFLLQHDLGNAKRQLEHDEGVIRFKGKVFRSLLFEFVGGDGRKRGDGDDDLVPDGAKNLRVDGLVFSKGVLKEYVAITIGGEELF